MVTLIKFGLIALITSALNIILIEAVTNQQISFYSESGSEGIRNSLTDSLLQVPQEIQNAKSFCTDLGLWKTTKISSSIQIPTNIEYHGGTLGGAYCINIPPDPTWTLKSVELIGPRDLETSSLSLFSKGKYQGTSEFVNGTETDFDIPIVVNSYFLTGTSNWALYTDPNYEGNVTCAEIITDITRTYGARGLSYTPQQLVVGSVRRGCDGDEFTTSRRPIGGGNGETNISPGSILYSLILVQIVATIL